jgi:chromosome segregation ATPase
MDRVFRQTLTGLADSQSAMMASVQNLTEANAQLTQALKHSMGSNQELQSKVATLTTVSSGLNSKIESLGSELQSLKRSLQTLSDNNQILNKSNHVLRQQQEDLNSALGSLTQELSTFKTSDASENDKPRW